MYARITDYGRPRTQLLNIPMIVQPTEPVVYLSKFNYVDIAPPSLTVDKEPIKSEEKIPAPLLPSPQAPIQQSFGYDSHASDFLKSPSFDASCSLDGGCHSNKALMDPRYNMREVVKQLILLEDHLTHPEKRCFDCITKHMMTVEGYLQEAMTLDKEQLYQKEIYDVLQQFLPLMKDAINNMKGNQWAGVDFCRCAQRLRALRKPLCTQYACYE